MNQRLALTIGADYGHSLLSSLSAAPRDIKELAAVLGDPTIGGFLVESSINEPGQIVRERIERLFLSARSDDLVVVAFSGHAITPADPGLALADTDPELPLSTTIGRRFFSSVLDEAVVEQLVVILDCCYSGGFRISGNDPLIRPRRGICVMTSSLANQESQAVGQLSVFTAGLVDGLRSGSVSGGQRADGLITARDLFAAGAEACRRSPIHQEARLHLDNDDDGDIVMARRPGGTGSRPLPIRTGPSRVSPPSARLPGGVPSEVGSPPSSRPLSVEPSSAHLRCW